MSKPLFIECECGERWKAATLPMTIGKVAGNLLRARCPNCGAGSGRIGMCPTLGPDAVTAARGGKARVTK